MPERTCIVTRAQKPEHELIRFVLSPQGKVVPDLKRKLPGRGCWVSKNHSILGQALAASAFSRAFGQKAEADATLPELVSSLMRQDMVAALAFCRKAGLAISGFTKVEDALSKGHVRALLHASGAAADGSAKLDRKASQDVVVLTVFTVAEMDLAFGRENVIHAALLEGGQTEKLLDLAQGLAQYESVKS